VRSPRAAVVGLLALMLAGCGASGPAPGSSIAATFGDPDGDAALNREPGEPITDRTELAPRRPVGRPLALFSQITDAHVRDEESPARLAVLDRIGPPFEASFRPQEALTPQVLTAAVRSLNALRPQAVVVTGDLVDNAQSNELDQALSVLRGGRVDPGSGRRAYSGPQGADQADPLFYRPDVDAPRYPGLLRRAERPFTSPGLGAPWYPVTGNHDILTQGVARPTPRTNAAARGGRMLTELDRRLREELPRNEAQLTPKLVDRALAGGLPGRTQRVPPDPRRRQVSVGELTRRLRAASGHGSPGPRLDYGFDIGPDVHAIALDVVRRDAGSTGQVAPEQAAFLRRELARAGRRWVVVLSHQALTSSAGGERLLEILDRHPRIAAVVSGHSHRNAIAPRRSSAGGYWVVSTASLADYPEQARAFRLVATTGGGAALETWMVNGSGEPLADVSRELSYVDAQGGRPHNATGGRGDRNVRLFLPPPRRGSG